MMRICPGESVTLLLTLIPWTPAQAGSLDLLEVGGAWGTPGANNPTAVWWNPAGLALGEGHQLLVEVAPTFGRVTAARDNPDYGTVDPSVFDVPDAPDSYDYSGTDTLSFTGAVPFLGVSSDLTVPGLGVGLTLAVPFGKGGGLADPEGANRYTLREGSIQTVYTSLGAAYRFGDLISVGVSGSLVNSRYYADTDATIYPDLAEGVIEEVPDAVDRYQDGYIEQPGYTVGSIFDLADTTGTFGAGIHLTPVGDLLGIAVSYNHGIRLDHTGDLTLQFRCPPEYDENARAAAEDLGTCGTTVLGDGSIGYDLPSRLHLGVVLRPIDGVRLEAMGAAVFWSAFDDYEVKTIVQPGDFVEARDVNFAFEAATLANQDRLWARDSRNTFWVGLDGKVALSEPWTVGGRVTFDRAAVPTSSVSANNYDADSLLLSGLVDWTPIKPLSVSLSFTQQFLAKREVTDSPFRVAVDPTTVEPRYFYPSANGTYTGAISRLGIALRARLP